ncbi:ATP-dependent metallopeptidase Hfl [Atractiella rhizophila]|nr:ATP-dependent metallopeptidase Hfl [Atractiella rhizophila]
MEHFKFNVAGGAAGARGFATQAPSKHQPNGKSTTTFEDVHGCEEAKEELVEIVEFLKNPVRFTKLGGKMPKGCLLIGPPGTGKTLLARAVAGEAGVQFFFASGAEFDEIFVGVGAARIRELFKQARANSPAIVFIDELDAIGSRRNPRDQQHSKQTLNQLLVELDGFNQTEGIIIIGATNFPEMLDKALTRPGRFDKEVVVPLPDVRGRLNILKHHLKTIKYDRSVDLSTVARGTIGFSGAELQNLVNQAAIKAAVDDQEMVTLRHMNWARDKILMGAERRSAVITPENKLATAYHEGGHALVALFNEHCDPLHQVTVMPRGRALGVTSSLPLMDKMNRSHVEYLARIQMAMGGRSAEKLLYGKENITDGASSDIRNASHVAHTMVRHFGFSDALGPVHLEKDDASISPQTRALIESEVRDIIEDQQTKAYELLEKHRVELDRLANALVEYETLSLEEVKEVIKGVPLLDRKRQLEEAKKLDVKEHDDQVGGDGGLGVIVDGGKEQEPAGLKRDR